MKITKYIHSCLLVEEQGYTILMDPGEYSYASYLSDLTSLHKLDYICITHEHADHYHIPFLQALLEKYPDVKVITNTELALSLQSINVPANSNIPSFITMEEVGHERVFGVSSMPANVQINLFDTLTHPGDSFSFNTTSRVLALPLQAPWGDVTEAVELAERLHPEVIVPIHDWHWKEEARQGLYQRLERYFKDKGIRFINLQSGEKVEV